MDDVIFVPASEGWGTVTAVFLGGIPIWLDKEVWKVDETLEAELNCKRCLHFYIDETEVFAAGECLKGRRLRLRDDNRWWPLGTAGRPQPPRYCSMREPPPPLG